MTTSSTVASILALLHPDPTSQAPESPTPATSKDVPLIPDPPARKRRPRQVTPIREQMTLRKSRSKLDCLGLVVKLFIENPDYENGPHVRQVIDSVGPEYVLEDFISRPKGLGAEIPVPNDPSSRQNLRSILGVKLIRRKGAIWNDALSRLIEVAVMGLGLNNVQSLSTATWQGPEADITEGVTNAFQDVAAIEMNTVAMDFASLPWYLVQAMGPDHLCVGGAMPTFDLTMDGDPDKDAAFVTARLSKPFTQPKVRMHTGIHYFKAYSMPRANVCIDFIPLDYGERYVNGTENETTHVGRDTLAAMHSWTRYGALQNAVNAINELRSGRASDDERVVDGLIRDAHLTPDPALYTVGHRDELIAEERARRLQLEKPLDVTIVPFPLGRITRAKYATMPKEEPSEIEDEKYQDGYRAEWIRFAQRLSKAGQAHGDVIRVIQFSDHSACPACGLDVTKARDGRKLDNLGYTCGMITKERAEQPPLEKFRTGRFYSTLRMLSRPDRRRVIREIDTDDEFDMDDEEEDPDDELNGDIFEHDDFDGPMPWDNLTTAADLGYDFDDDLW